MYTLCAIHLYFDMIWTILTFHSFNWKCSNVRRWAIAIETVFHKCFLSFLAKYVGRRAWINNYDVFAVCSIEHLATKRHIELMTEDTLWTFRISGKGKLYHIELIRLSMALFTDHLFHNITFDLIRNPMSHVPWATLL